jgi:hypothetical protein
MLKTIFIIFAALMLLFVFSGVGFTLMAGLLGGLIGAFGGLVGAVFGLAAGLLGAILGGLLGLLGSALPLLAIILIVAGLVHLVRIV